MEQSGSPLWKFLGILLGLTVLTISIGGLVHSTYMRKTSEQAPAQLKVGYIDRKGSWVVRPTFTGGQAFQGDLAIVEKNLKKGVIDREGNVVAKPIYHSIKPKKKFLVARHENGLEIIRPDGSISEYTYATIGTFQNGLAPIRYRDRWGFVHTTGEVRINPVYRKVGSFSGGAAPAKKKNWGLIDKEGATVLPFSYDRISAREDGLFAIEKENRVGVATASGQVLAEPAYDRIRSFSEGLAPVLKKGKWGFINREGALVVKPRFTSVGPFQNGRARVVNDAGEDSPE